MKMQAIAILIGKKGVEVVVARKRGAGGGGVEEKSGSDGVMVIIKARPSYIMQQGGWMDIRYSS
jgi:hypothetical protein